MPDLDKWPNPIKLSALYQDAIAERVGVDQDTVSEWTKELRNLDKCPNSVKLSVVCRCKGHTVAFIRDSLSLACLNPNWTPA